MGRKGALDNVNSLSLGSYFANITTILAGECLTINDENNDIIEQQTKCYGSLYNSEKYIIMTNIFLTFLRKEHEKPEADVA